MLASSCPVLAARSWLPFEWRSDPVTNLPLRPASNLLHGNRLPRACTHTHTCHTHVPHTYVQALLELMSTQSALAREGAVDDLLEAALQEVERIVSALSGNTRAALRIFCPCAAEGVIAKLVSLGFVPIRRLPQLLPASAWATAAGAQASAERGGCDCAEVLPLPSPSPSLLPSPSTSVAAAGMGTFFAVCTMHVGCLLRPGASVWSHTWSGPR